MMVVNVILALIAAFGISVLSLLVVGAMTDTVFSLRALVLMTVVVAAIIGVFVF